MFLVVLQMIIWISAI